MTPHFFSQFLSVPLALDERHAATLAIALRSIAASKGKSEKSDDDEEDENGFTVSHDRFGNRIRRAHTAGGTATIPLHGVVSRGLGPLGEYYGFTDVSKFTASVMQAAADSEVERIVLDMNTPGGTVLGTRDAARAVSEAARVKPVLAYTDGLMASAGYYIAAGATRIMAGEGAIVGSVGVITALMDATEFYKGMGLTIHVFRSGEQKAIGAYGADKIDDKKSSFVQEEVERIGAEFRSFVQAHRAIQDEDLEGQVFTGAAAVAHNLIDGTATTLTEALRLYSQK